jgi:phage gpG-like protein
LAKQVHIDVNDRDLQQVVKWIDSIGSNKKKLWKQMIPVMREQVSKEFSDANPNEWKALKPSYVQWKMDQGYPATIGVRTGNLKDAATTNALTTYTDEYLVYQINSNMATAAEGFNYFLDFNRKRKIFKHTERYMNSLYRQSAESWLNADISKGAK